MLRVDLEIFFISDQNRQKFKEIVNTLATVKLDEVSLLELVPSVSTKCHVVWFITAPLLVIYRSQYFSSRVLRWW